MGHFIYKNVTEGLYEGHRPIVVMTGDGCSPTMEDIQKTIKESGSTYWQNFIYKCR